MGDPEELMRELNFVRELNEFLERALNAGVAPSSVAAACLAAAGQVSAAAIGGSEDDGVAMAVVAAQAMADAHRSKSAS